MSDEGCERANRWCWIRLCNSNPFTQLGHELQVHAQECLIFPFRDVPFFLHAPPP
jgi:hypothetical protein